MTTPNTDQFNTSIVCAECGRIAEYLPRETQRLVALHGALPTECPPCLVTRRERSRDAVAVARATERFAEAQARADARRRR